MKMLNLIDVPLFYINMEEATQRREKMEGLIERVGFKNATRVEGPKKDHPWHGCAAGHLAAMRAGGEPPFIVLEDDCVAKTMRHLASLSIPEDADCLYLGISDRGLENSVDFFRHDRELVRLHNMLGAHAIMFLTKEYTKACTELAEECVAQRGRAALDISYARIMKDWNVYALACPLFYQEKCVLKTNIRFKMDCPYIDDSVES